MVSALLGGECQVWWACARHARPSAYGLLDPVERDRHDALRDAAARDRFAIGRAVIRLACGQLLRRAPEDVRLDASCARCGRPHGRPRLADARATLQISLAHSGAYVVVAVADGVEVGVDVERVVLRGGRPPLSALSPAECAVLDAMPDSRRAAAFVRYWVRKEAVLKATGHGLSVPPRRLTVSPPDAPAALLSWTGRPTPHLPVHLVDLPAPEGYAAGLASLGRPVRATRHDADALLAQYEHRFFAKIGEEAEHQRRRELPMSDAPFSPIIPFLRYRDTAAAVDWLVDAFGFERFDISHDDSGAVVHAELRFGRATVQLGPAGDGKIPMRSPRDLPFTNQGVYVYVGGPDDVDAHFKRATQAGAEVLYEPYDTHYGERNYGVRDLEGHIWSFGSYVPTEATK